jgi:predicted molibdopterin-dependent oxidoreductase YjgC
VSPFYQSTRPHISVDGDTLNLCDPSHISVDGDTLNLCDSSHISVDGDRLNLCDPSHISVDGDTLNLCDPSHISVDGDTLNLCDPSHISVDGDTLNLCDPPFHETYQFLLDVQHYTRVTELSQCAVQHTRCTICYRNKFRCSLNNAVSCLKTRRLRYTEL